MEPCLQSLSEQTCRDFKVLVVDNASSDGSLEYMSEHYPDIEVISLKKNYGFSKAVNVGIEHSTTPYVILLNNDTTVDTHYVEEMIKAIEKSPRIFSVSSKMIQMYHPELIDSAGDLYTLMAAIYRRNAFSKIGLFDENHFAYLEDIDVGYRAKIYGYKNTYCPTALVYHVGSGTSGSKYNSFKVKLSARNNIYLNYKNMPFLQLILNFIPLFLGCVVKYLFFMHKGFGKDYACGIKEGLSHAREQKKVAFKLRHLPNYILIEFELILHTLSYARDWFRRKLFKK